MPAQLAARGLCGASLQSKRASAARFRPSARVTRTAPRKGVVYARASQDASSQAQEVLNDLKEKWDNLENKSTVLLYAGGGALALFVSTSVVSTVNSVPLLPKMMELVGLGYSTWFAYRYLLFKDRRKELVKDLRNLKNRISGDSEASQ